MKTSTAPEMKVLGKFGGTMADTVQLTGDTSVDACHLETFLPLRAVPAAHGPSARAVVARALTVPIVR
jgi:hypothetical protein